MNKNIDVFAYKAVFFDLDGTLIDSAKDLSFAINLMSDELNIKKPSLQQVKNWIGNGALKLIENVLLNANQTQPTEKELNHAFHIFSKAYKKSVGENCTVYDGAQKLLVQLLSKRIKVACITNKPLEFTEFLLQLNMISQYFTVICAGDKVKHPKPHAWPLIHVSEILEVNIKDCLMIGDSSIDVEAARNAGCDVMAVSYGYNQGNDIKEFNPDRIIDSFNEVL
ncbi:MAG: phosphoglycolate phosphatase [Marinicellaceae bacterium]